MSLYGNLADITGGASDVGTPGISGKLLDVSEEASQLADALAKANDPEMGPRDYFMLRAMRPLARSEIAYVDTLRLYKVKKPNENRGDATADALVLQFVTASQEMAQVSVANTSQMEPYRLYTRFVMLNNANVISGEYKEMGVRSPASEPQLKAEVNGFKAFYETGAGKAVLDGVNPTPNFNLLGVHN